MRTGRLQVLFSIPKMAAVEAGKLKNGDCCRKCFPAFQKWSPLDVSCLTQRALVLQDGGMGKAFQHPVQKLTIDQAKKAMNFLHAEFQRAQGSLL